MVASTLLVEADLSGTAFGGAFVPTDITRFVRLVDGISIDEWRQDALSNITPMGASLTLDNDALAGDATAPNAGRFTPGLSSSPWSGRLIPGVRVRITETVGGTAFQLGDGYVLDWTTQPGSSDDGTFPLTKINLTDALGWMGTLQPLQSIYTEEATLDGPLNLLPLDEPAGSPSAGDLLNRSVTALIRPSKLGTAGASYAFAADTGLADGTTGLQLVGNGNNGYQLWLPSLPAPASGRPQIEILFSTTATAQQTIYSEGTLNIQMDASGHISVFGVGTSAGTYNDGKPHHLVVAVWVALGTKGIIYIDGVVDGLNLGVAGTVGIAAGEATIGGDVTYGARTGITFGYFFNGVVWGFNRYDSAGAPSPTRVADRYTAAMTAFAGERTDVHMARLLSYRPNTGSVLDVGRSSMGRHDTKGKTLQTALLETAQVEGGVVFAGDQGRIVLLSRSRLYNPASTATFDAEADLIADSFQTRIDTQDLVNDQTITRPGGAAQRIVNAASKATYGPRQASDELVINSDRDAADAAGWRVVNAKDAKVRTPSFSINITTMTSTSQAQAALGRQPLDRVALSNLPSWAPPIDEIIQGRSIRIDQDSFVVSFFATPRPKNTLRADAAASANTKLDNGLVIPW